MVFMQGLCSASACHVDFARASGHCRAVVKRTIGNAKWCKLGTAFAVCAAIPCSEQVLPLFLAQIASFDRDHAVAMYATSDGVDLVLTHDGYGSHAVKQGQFFTPRRSQPAHVVT
jgi:hypothetical protein